MPPAKPTTISDVARRAGVSKMAVSVVINGARSSTQVSAQTRARILQAAEELDYRPNAIARSLARRRSDIVGFYNGYKEVSLHTLFLVEVLAGLQEGCEQFHKDLLIHGTFRGSSIDDIYAELSNGKVDGLILFSPVHDPLIQRLADSPLPVVAIADAIPALPTVVVDDTRGARLLAEHLASRGHRRVLCRPMLHNGTSLVRRREAFLATARAQGMTVYEDTPENHKPQLNACERDWLDPGNPQRATAGVCWTDGESYIMLSECLRLGLRVPQDVALVGFDGISSEVLPKLRLTTIHAAWSDVTRTAVSLLADRIEGKEVALETVLPVRLVVGETT